MNVSSLAYVLVACVAISVHSFGADPKTFDYQPAPVDNPLKGLVPYVGKGMKKDSTAVFPHSMEFSYLPLSEIMHGMAEFDWEPIESLLDDISNRGHQTVLRIYLEYPGKDNSIPLFLIEGGLKVHRYRDKDARPPPTKDTITPDYDDPNLREALSAFIDAFGARYDGDPRLGFVTAGLLGAWGEWHNYQRSDLWASKDTQKVVMDAYAAAFKTTPVLLRYPAGPDDGMYVDNRESPFGYHDDSFSHSTLPTGNESADWFFVPRLQANDLMTKWRRHPIGGEVRPEVWGCCFDDPPCTPPGQGFFDCVEATHVSWLMDSGVFTKPLNEARRVNALRAVQRMGYEFHVTSASVEDSHLANTLSVAINVANRGVAPFYAAWPLHVGLVDNTDALIHCAATPVGLAGIQPSVPEQATSGSLLFFTVSTADVPTGEYELVISTPNPMPGGHPVRFANTTQDQHVDGWLSLGQITIRH